MEVILYSPSIRDRWDAFVSGHKYAWVGHYSATFELEKEFGGDNISFLVVDDRHDVIGILPLFLFEKRVVKKTITLRSIRSGSSLRNGPLFLETLSEKQKREALDLLMQHLLAKARASKVDDINISYPVMHGDKMCLEHYGYLPLKKYGFVEGNTVAMVKDLRSDEQTLLASFRHNCRNAIKRCLAEGGEYVDVLDRAQWMDCYELNVQTFSAGGTSPYTMRVLEILWDNFVETGLAEVTAIRLKGKIICIQITAVRQNACYPWIGFNSKPAPIPGMDNLLDWKTMLHFKERGVEYFEIGSREFNDSKQIRISVYKESFQGRDTYCLEGKLILRPIKESMLRTVSLLRNRTFIASELASIVSEKVKE